MENLFYQDKHVLIHSREAKEGGFFWHVVIDDVIAGPEDCFKPRYESCEIACQKGLLYAKAIIDGTL